MNGTNQSHGRPLQTDRYGAAHGVGSAAAWRNVDFVVQYEQEATMSDSYALATEPEGVVASLLVGLACTPFAKKLGLLPAPDQPRPSRSR